MKGFVSQSGKLSGKGRGAQGQGRYCSNQLAESGPNRNCMYRRNSWTGSLRPLSSIVLTILSNLRRMADRGIERVRISSIEQRRLDRERNEMVPRDTADKKRMM
jgi:hypothetical protein